MSTVEQVKGMSYVPEYMGSELLDSVSGTLELVNHWWFRQDIGYVFSPRTDLHLEVQIWPGEDPGVWVLFEIEGDELIAVDVFDDLNKAIIYAEVVAYDKVRGY